MQGTARSAFALLQAVLALNSMSCPSKPIPDHLGEHHTTAPAQ